MTRRDEILQHAIECGCIEGTAEYYGFLQGAEWADAHQPQVVALEHEIEVLKSKLQAADDLNTLLTAELEKAKSQWISVEDRLPEINQVVLTLGSEKNNEDVRLLYRSPASRKFACLDYDEITHWMPIPELLKGGEK